MGRVALCVVLLWAMMTPHIVRAADTVVETALFTSGERIRLEEGGEPFAFVIDLEGSFRSVERPTIEFFFVDDVLDSGEGVAIFLGNEGRIVRHFFSTPQSRRSITSTAGNSFVNALRDGLANARLEAIDGSVIVSQIVIPLGMCFTIQTFSTLDASDIWLAIVLGHLTRATLSAFVFKREKWKHIEVEMEPAKA